MSAKGRKKRSEPERFKTSWLAYLGRMLMTIFFVVLILYVTLLAASRTQGFRSLVSERFEALMQMEVAVGESKLTPSLQLVLGEVVASLEGGGEVPSLRIDTLRMKWVMGRLFSSLPEHVGFVRGEGVSVHIQREGGEVFPACLEVLAPVASMALGDLEADVRSLLLGRGEDVLPGYVLDLRGSRMVWWNGGEQEVELEDFHFTYSPHGLDSSVVHLYRFKAEALRRPLRPVLGPLEIECQQRGGDVAFLKAEVDRGVRPRVVGQRRSSRDVEKSKGVGRDRGRQEDLEGYFRSSLEEAIAE